MDSTALARLMTWLSPSYPVGAYSYSHGLEWAVDAGDVATPADLEGWIGDILINGSGRNDAVLFAHAHRGVVAGNGVALAAVAELACAFVSSAERHLETSAQGAAFLKVSGAVWPCRAIDLLRSAWRGPVAYPVAVAVVAAGHGIAALPALVAYLHAFAANLVSAGVRLVPLGQTDGQRAMAGLIAVIERVADAAGAARLDELGGAALRADLSALRHETQETRLFRS